VNLPRIESKLRSLDVFSAWSLLPDIQVGIVHIKNDKHFGDVLALVSQIATARVGVSARYEDLRGLRIAIKAGSEYFDRFDDDTTLKANRAVDA